MKSKGLICCILVVSLFCASFADDINVTVTVTGNAVIAETDESFVCVTLDWWPENKCDFDQCPWGKAGILNLDLNNTILENAVKAFGNLRIRVGGSLQDQVFYNVGGFDGTCSDFTRDDGGLFGFSTGCLDMNRWDQMNTFFNKTGAVITFGLNALNGRSKSPSDNSLMIGNWDSTNAFHFMNYTFSEKGYTIDSYEFGNELSGGGVGASVDAEQYAKDTKVLKNVIESVYGSNSATNPQILGPGGFYDEYQKQWFAKFLIALEPDVLDVVSHHVYNLGPGNGDVISHILNPDFVNSADDFYNGISSDIQHTALWVSESGGAYTSGKKDVSDAYVDGFWYLNQLGLTSIHHHTVFCRQALIGGNYGLLDVNTFDPKPDYYGALLWHRLMGKKVLFASHNGTDQYLRVYAHCSKLYITGVSLLIINMSNSTFEVSVEDINKSYPTDSPQNRTEYHLTPENGDILSKVVLVNGTPLKLTGKSDIPEFNPSFVNATSPIRVDQNSMVFATISDYNAIVCTD